MANIARRTLCCPRDINELRSENMFASIDAKELQLNSLDACAHAADRTLWGRGGRDSSWVSPENASQSIKSMELEFRFRFYGLTRSVGPCMIWERCVCAAFSSL